MRRLLATTSLSLAFIAAPACDKDKKEEKKEATAKSDKGKADADKGKADKGKADEKKADEKKADEKKAGEAGGEAAVKAVAVAGAAGGAGLVDLVPDAATGLLVVNFEGLIGTAVYKSLGPEVESAMGKNLASAKACSLGVDTWKRLVVGADPNAKEDSMVVIMAAAGIGKKENIECLAAKYKEEDPKADWKTEEQDGRVVVTVDGGDGMVYSAGNDTVVMTTKAWNAAVKERLDGKGTAAVAGSLKDALGLADGTKYIYGAALATSDMAVGPFVGAKHVGIAMDVSDVMEVSLAVAFADVDTAKGKATELNSQFQGFKGLAPGFGVPQGVVDSVKIEAKDSAVTLAVKATVPEAKKLVEAVVKAMLSGAGR